MSGWPSVVRNAVRAVLPVRIALIARVVPWMKVSPRREEVARAAGRGVGRGQRQRIEHALDRIVGRGRGLVHAAARRPSSTTRSVKVPPVSQASRIPSLAGAVFCPAGCRRAGGVARSVLLCAAAPRRVNRGSACHLRRRQRVPPSRRRTCEAAPMMRGARRRDLRRRGARARCCAAPVCWPTRRAGRSGPRGARCCSSGRFAAPIVSRNGYAHRASRSTCPTALENLGVQALREVAWRTSDAVGDGTATAMVLTRALLADGVRPHGGGA